ncbi:hypothetical protein, partial [Mycobacterium avium]|uniref:hypothetical protein n=1 Tax=Mycobacterium avium TaxID=1764 RepID=UPI00266617FB
YGPSTPQNPPPTLPRRSAPPRNITHRSQNLGQPIYTGFRTPPFDGGPDGSALIVQLTFDGFEVSEIKEISDTGLESMDFVIETDRDSWLDMVDNIRAGDGRPDLDHTLNALSMASTPIRVWSSDPLGKDMFFRYNQSLQHFINKSARL